MKFNLCNLNFFFSILLLKFSILFSVFIVTPKEKKLFNQHEKKKKEKEIIVNISNIYLKLYVKSNIYNRNFTSTKLNNVKNHPLKIGVSNSFHFNQGLDSKKLSSLCITFVFVRGDS